MHVRGRRQDERVVRPVRNMVAGRHALARQATAAGDRSVRYDWRVLDFWMVPLPLANIETTVLSTCRRHWSRRYRSGHNLVAQVIGGLFTVH